MLARQYLSSATAARRRTDASIEHPLASVRPLPMEEPDARFATPGKTRS